jgi:Zn-dependent protease with chaperone function
VITGYVGRGEKILFSLALAFSLFVYGFIAIGIGAAVIGGGSVRTYPTNSLDDYEGSGFSDEEYLKELPDEGFSDGGIVDEELIERIDEDIFSGEEPYEEYDEFNNDDFLMDGERAASMGLWGVASIFIFYIALIVLIVLFAHIIAVGHLMGNGVRVSEKQFPELWAIFGRASIDIGIKKLPAFYLVESGGILNAFATRLFTRSYVAIYADLAERLYEGDEESVFFVVAHELVHVKRNHMLRNLITLPAEMIPFMKTAWRRACEYSCDTGAALVAPAGAEKGLILLAAGKKLSARLDAEAYLESFYAEKSAWKRIAELTSSHPHLPKRIQALRNPH